MLRSSMDVFNKDVDEICRVGELTFVATRRFLESFGESFEVSVEWGQIMVYKSY